MLFNLHNFIVFKIMCLVLSLSQFPCIHMELLQYSSAAFLNREEEEGALLATSEIFLIATIYVWGATGIEWVHVRDAAKHPMKHKDSSPQQRIIWPKRSVVLRLRTLL